MSQLTSESQEPLVQFPLGMEIISPFETTRLYDAELPVVNELPILECDIIPFTEISTDAPFQPSPNESYMLKI